jgi:NADH-quinone oxidoreductase subunit H
VIAGELALQITGMVITGICLLAFLVVLCFFLGYMERKVAAFMEIRLGPNRVGPKGSLQIVADTLKLLFKEGLAPDKADKFLFNLAPGIVLVTSMLALAPIAWAKNFQIWDINIGVLYVSSISSMAVIGILMAGWSSSNKYSLIGAMRCGAQIVSYELSIGLSLISIVILSGSLGLNDIVNSQSQWLVDFQRTYPRNYCICDFHYCFNGRNQPSSIRLNRGRTRTNRRFPYRICRYEIRHVFII